MALSSDRSSTGTGIVLYQGNQESFKNSNEYIALIDNYQNGLSLSEQYDTLPDVFQYLTKLPLVQTLKNRGFTSPYLQDYYDGEEELSIIKFPIIVENRFNPSMSFMVIDDPDSVYALPPYVENHFCELFSAYRQKTDCNNTSIRVNDIDFNDDVLIMKTGRTTYFDAIVTNYSMDTPIEGGPTIRQIYEYDWIIPSLKQSKLANPLSFNIIIYTSDSYLILIEKNRDMYTNENMYENGIETSVKTRYMFDEPYRKITTEDLIDSIATEIMIRLGLTREEMDLIDFSFRQNFTSFYRDITRGGKPHLSFWLEVPFTFEELSQKFSEVNENTGHSHLEEGMRMIGMEYKEFEQSLILPNGIIFLDNNTNDLVMLPMIPKTSAALMLFRLYYRGQ